MGYPMTFRRLINRNGLADGDYQRPPSGWTNSTSVAAHLGLDNEFCGFQSLDALRTAYRSQFDRRNEERTHLGGRLALFAGDLRRLETDTVDERALCKTIAIKSGIDPETVAAVLKEWINT